MYTDGSHEFEKAWRDLGWIHHESTPYRPETNGVAERAVRRTKEGKAATLIRSGFDEQWWNMAIECCCFLWNIVVQQTIKVKSALREESSDKQEVIATLYKHRFKEDFRGPVYPSGAFVEYKPSSDKDSSAAQVRQERARRLFSRIPQERWWRMVRRSGQSEKQIIITRCILRGSKQKRFCQFTNTPGVRSSFCLWQKD